MSNSEKPEAVGYGRFDAYPERFTAAAVIDWNSVTTQTLTRVIAMHACNCIGPQRGEPKCPCMMRGVIVRNGRYIQAEVDLGPAPTASGSPATAPAGSASKEAAISAGGEKT
jgi:hypothetical protein